MNSQINHVTHRLPELSAKQAWRWLMPLCIGHVILWTLSSSLTRGSVTHDTLEGIAWGMQWQWGYDKHPPLAAWLSAWATQWGGSVGWPVYALSQIAVVVIFVAVFLCARLIFPLSLALVAAFLSEGILYHNINSINFTPDTVQTPLWALATFFFYQAIRHQRQRDWLGVGILAGLCVLAKYSAVFLFASQSMILVLTPEGRHSFRRPAFYLAIGVACCIIAPHIWWAWSHGLTGVQYIQDSLSSGEAQSTPWWHHLYYPAKFFLSQFAVMCGALVLAWPMWRSPKNTVQTVAFDRFFIVVMGLAPFVMTILYAAITGHRMIPRWATPYFFFIGPLLVLLLRPTLTQRKLHQTLYTTFIVMCLVVVLRGAYFVGGPMWFGKTRSDAYLPNHAIAEKVTTYWHHTMQVPLRFVAGDHYLTAFISAYSPDKPAPYMSWSRQESPWVDENEMQKHGAMFTWEVKSIDQNQIPTSIAARFPRAKMVDVWRFEKNIKVPAKPIYIAVAILAPERRF